MKKNSIRLKAVLLILLVMGTVPVFAQIYHPCGTYHDGLALVSGYTSANGYSKKYGYVNEYNQLVIPLKYESAGDFHDGYTSVGLGIKHGIINKAGKIVVPIEYDNIYWGGNENNSNIYPQLKECYFLHKGNKRGVFKKGKMIIPCDKYWFSVTDCSGYMLFVCGEDGGCSLYNETGESVLPKGYLCDKLFSYKLFENFVAIIKDGKCGIYNLEKREIVIEPCFDRYDGDYAFGRATNNYLLTKKDGKVGLLDEKFREIYAPVYDKIIEDKNGKLFLYKGNKIGIYDLENRKEILPPIYECKGEPGNGELTFLYANGKVGVWNYGMVIAPDTYDDVQILSSGRLMVIKDGKRGLYEKDGTNFVKVLSPLYDSIIEERNGFVLFKGSSGWGVTVRNCGKDEAYYDEKPECFPIGWVVKKNGKYGAWNGSYSDTRFVLDQKPEEIDYRYMKVKINGKCGVYNYQNGELEIPAEYDDICFNNYMAMFAKNGKYGVAIYMFKGRYDKHGSSNGFTSRVERMEFPYDDVRLMYLPSSEVVYAAIKKNGKWGYARCYYNAPEEIIIKPKYDEVGDFENGKALVRKGKKEFYIDKYGKKLN